MTEQERQRLKETVRDLREGAERVRAWHRQLNYHMMRDNIATVRGDIVVLSDANDVNDIALIQGLTIPVRDAMLRIARKMQRALKARVATVSMAKIRKAR